VAPPPPALESVETLPGLLAAQAASRPRDTALRWKRLGIWREYGWAALADAVRDVALGFDELGVGAGDCVAIFAANDPRWLVADLAVQTLRGTCVGLQAVQDADELAANLATARPAIIVCGDQQHVDNVLAVRDRIPPYSKLVVFELKGLHTPEYHDEPIISHDALRALGAERHSALPGRHAELLAAVAPDDASVVCFTAGTTGRPRGVVLTQRGQVAMGRLLAAHVGARPDDRGYSLLPLGHTTARAFDVVVPLVSGASLNFPESQETIESDLAELSPTLVLATPRFYARLRSTMRLRAARATAFKRVTFRFGMRQLEKGLAARRKGGRAGLAERTGRLLTGRWVLDKAGLLQVRYAGVTCAPVADDLLDWFWQLGLPLRELYSQVEVGGASFAQRGVEDAGTTGVALGDGIEARVEDGELYVRTPGLLAGRLGGGGGDDVVDGWFATGDLGELDGAGRLVVRDRRSGLFATSGGDTVSAGEVAEALERSPYVATAVVGCDGRPFVIALIELELEAVAEWAKGRDKPVTTYAALAADGDVRELIAEQVEAANTRLDDPSQVRGFAITRQPLHDERTFTGTVQREAVLARYADLMESLYGSPVSPVAA
jgi:long-chain acyl-CoA synthetase